MEWAEFGFAFLAFFASHSIPVRPPVKPWLVSRLGATGFTIVYSILSIGVLVWLIGAAYRAPYVPLWHWAPWQSYVILSLMLPACLILAVSIGRPNPFSFGGGANQTFDPAQPGIVRWTRHPLLLALALWAFAHLISNGDLAHVLLFGSFAAFALIGGPMLDRRKRRELGDEWPRLLAEVRQAGLAPKPRRLAATGVKLALGVGLFLGLIVLHPLVIGVSPLP